jgi:alpha-ribazole phosphatase
MIDPPTRVILVRHSEPEATLNDRCCGSPDVALSATGREQAAALAADLARVDVVRIYASPLRRADETAAAIAARQGIPFVTLDDLRELDFGDCEGRRYDEIAASMPDLYARWMSAPTTVEFPGGESYAALRRRVIPAATSIRAEVAGRTAVVVTHGGVCRALLADVLQLRADLIFRLDVGYARVTVIDWHGEEPVVRLVNASVSDLVPPPGR